MLDLIPLTRDSCSDNGSLSVRVVAPKENKDMLLLYFSSEDGTFYNQNSPRITLPVDQDGSRRVLYQQCQSNTECSQQCKDEVEDWRGRKCCQNIGITDEICLLNSEGNVCSCVSDNRACYIEMRQTMQIFIKTLTGK